MAGVYSKSFFYNTVTPGTPLSFMTGPISETWIMRSILMTAATAGFGWSVEIMDGMGNLVFQSGIESVSTDTREGLRVVLAPATNYTVSAGTYNVFVAIDGYVLSS